MSTIPLGFDDVQRWLVKGILANRLNATDGMAADSLKNATKSLLLAFIMASIVEFIIVFLFQPQAKYDQLFGFPLFITSLTIGTGSFVAILLVFLWITRSKLQARAVVSLTFYVLSGLIPVLIVLLREQLIQAIQLFIQRRDPSLPYLAAGTMLLLQPGRASMFAVTRAWIFFLLEIAAMFWYLVWNLRRVLIESSAVDMRAARVTTAILASLVLNGVVDRYYTGRLFWLILGRLLS